MSEFPGQEPLHHGPQRRMTRWEHEEVLETVQRRLDRNPGAMRQRREVVEHPFGTTKIRSGPSVSVPASLSRRF